MSSPLLCLALRNFVDLTACNPVDLVCSRTMSLECEKQTVTLQPENQIPELPDKFSPMFPEEEEAMDPATSSPPAAEDQTDEMHYVKEALNEIPCPSPPGLLELTMYTFTTPQSRKALQNFWCKTSGSCILERPCYVPVREKVERLWDSGVLAVLLLGVPGIGKTAFIITTLLKLLNERKPVAFQTKGGSLYFYEPQHNNESKVIGQDYSCLRLKNNGILLDPEVYYLVDGKLPCVPEFGCKSLLAAIPKLSNFQDYDKDGRGNQVILPVWSAAELAVAWQVMFDPTLPHVQALKGEEELLEARKMLTLDVVKERYRRWGGTARFVLEKLHIDLDTIVRGLQSIQRTVEAVGQQIADGDHPCHKVVHQRVKQGYNGYEYMFASPYLVKVATEKLSESTSGELRLFLSFKGLAAHGVNGCKGHVFQHEFMTLTQKYSRRCFKVRRVHDDINVVSQDEERVFEFGEVVKVDKIENVSRPWPVNRIIWPDSPMEETVDAMTIVQPTPQDLPELELFQATLSSERHEHGLKYSGILKVMEHFGIPPSRTRVYITTTSELYPEAGYQNWRKSRALKDQRIIRRLVGITQYAMDSGI
ncbi:hypothetical protein SELMODRAFT_422418 [Selaginella moellendorffii]|uniref:Uncharacterized protein n=2 Tax=Selaginella moellendorffii TaxID=88036 RepID=D8SIB8_SELML|nr:hypothetical protein SELMODRAFT_422418 [Selaginella moellendorffii]